MSRNTSTYNRLRRVFEYVSFAALATQASACSETHTLSREGFDSMVPCGDDAALVAGVRPADEVNYLAVRRIYVPYGSDTVPDPHITGEVGVPCAEATDGDACDAALGGLPTGEGFDETPIGPVAYGLRHQLVWTRGDEVGAVTNEAELRAFLGTIDSEEEAALVARFAMGHSLVCDGPNARLVVEGIEVITTTGFACGEGTERVEHVLLIAPDGTVEVRQSVVVEVGDPNCAIGRLTDGPMMPSHVRHETLGSYFAEMAALEASAVVAFDRLARELRALRAPEALVTRALEARDDEARHAQIVGELARKFGESPREAGASGSLPLREALELALENAREGCVRETFGALIATHQAKRARDPRVAEVLRAIADDETRHAAFSWDLAEWLDSRLTAAERALVRSERAAARHLFGGGSDDALSAEDREAAGLPDPETTAAMKDALRMHLYEA